MFAVCLQYHYPTAFVMRGKSVKIIYIYNHRVLC